MSYVVWLALAIGMVALFALRRASADPAQLQPWLDRGASIVDVRTPDEFRSGHVRGARNIPVDQLEARLTEVPQGPVIVYCASGIRSWRARALLEGAGREVLDMGRLARFPRAMREAQGPP